MDKLKSLQECIRKLESVLVCYSGGADSTLLLYLSQQVLGENAHAVFFDSVIIPEQDRIDAEKIANAMNARLHIRRVDILGNPTLACNPKDRCYICKHNLLSQAKILANDLGLRHVIEGSHADDLLKHRPGRQAVRELGVYSPFEQAGIGKSEIRAISKLAGLPTWQKPSFSCLMTRMPHGETVTEKDLKRVELAEKFIRELGFQIFRVRHLGEKTRLEVGTEECDLLERHKKAILRYLKQQGYRAAELAEYRP